MPQFLTIRKNNLSISEDNIDWVVGDNTIVFPEPFADTLYTLDVHSGDVGVTVKEKPGTRTQTGVEVTVTGGTTDSGYYYVEGKSDEYGTDSWDEGYRQRGTKKLLVAGENTITFQTNFRDTTYTFTGQLMEDGKVYPVPGSKQKGQIKVYSIDDYDAFDWVAFGIKE